ncbi:hypothetical protein GPECTOR_1g814 [Gonium pectorale]|uniref:RimM N-terminal domain-containing protein n=1 Tax=Gonium pectorale TaxID=33097 RepID=A0A150H4B6_GONPE|nr:hypothetical protein GPECTOR_1g814 [Gonium pectorale]|eukprot:KXZ56903.1 hypothetical protein GPECTOR_1g814 [Gonium pectorale]
MCTTGQCPPVPCEEYVEVGRVTGAHGVRGEVRVEASTDEPVKRFKAGRRLFLVPPSAQGSTGRGGIPPLSLIPVTSRGARDQPMGKGQVAWLLALQEVATRTQAEQLYGHMVYCALSDRESLRDPDEFYVTDIIGCSVIDQASRRLVGSVVDVYSGMGTHDTLRVKLRANEADIMNSRIRYCLFPFAKAICPVLDLGSRTLEVAPPEGLLDLYTVEPLKRPLSEEAKAQKLQQLREQLAREEAERHARGQQQVEVQSSSGQEEAADDEDEGEDADEEEGEKQVRAVRLRRPGLGRRTGSLRLGRRRT